jgi:membrane associated rhomboid family serine protease
VIPLKDDIPARHFPVVTVALIAGGATALLLTEGTSAWVVALSALFLWLFGPSVEDSMGPLRYVAFVAVGVGATALAGAGPEECAAGAVAAVLGGYALLYPHAHVVALGFVPGLMSVYELPALAVAALWLPLQALAGGLEPEPLAGLAAGALTVRPAAHRVQRDYRRAPAY